MTDTARERAISLAAQALARLGGHKWEYWEYLGELYT